MSALVGFTLSVLTWWLLTDDDRRSDDA